LSQSRIKGGVGQRTPAAHQIPEADPALIIQSHDFTIQNDLLSGELVPQLLREARMEPL
jgi:hypothetical protein